MDDGSKTPAAFLILSPIGVMRMFAALLAMSVTRQSVAPLKVDGEKRRAIHEAEDLVVFFSNPINNRIWLAFMHAMIRLS